MSFPDQHSLEQFLLEEFDGYDRTPLEAPLTEKSVVPRDDFSDFVLV